MGRCGLLLTLWALLPGRPVKAQTPGPPGFPGHRRVGLALSGGAARALAHIGVLKVLEQAGVAVNAVAGTSMGSVVGGLYAAGYTSGALDTIAVTEDWSGLLTDPVRRRDLPVGRKFTENHYLLTLPIYRGAIHLPRSVVAGQRISQLLARLTWPVHSVRDFRRLPIPFAAVATDLETGKAVVLDHGFLPDVIRASTAIPSVFSPVEIEGRVLIDGGVVRNLPAEDARALGADLLICSDVTDPLEPRDSIVSFVDVLVQSVSFRIWDSEDQQRRQCDVLIKPDVRAFPAFGFNRVRDIIARGEAAARAALPEIETALSRSSAGARELRPPVPTPESVLVTTVRFDDPGRIPQRFLVRALGLKPPTWVSRRELDQGIDRLYATGLFETVRYRLEALPGGAERRELTVLVREPSAGRFGVGLRYDSRYKASVLLSGILGGVGFGANGRVDVRLGQQSQVGVGVSPSVGELKTVTLGARADYTHTPFDLYEGEHRVAQVRVDLGALSASMAKNLGTAAELTAWLKAEHARWDQEVSAVDSGSIERTFYSAAGVAEVDTYDRGLFPRRGVGLKALSEWGNRLAGGGGSFSHHFAEVRGYLPVYRTISLWGGVTVGASGGDPPPHYQFFLGGANAYYVFPDRDISFVGLNIQELRGRHVQKIELGAQWEFLRDVFGRVRWNAGNVFDRWRWDPAGYLDGVGMELAAKTFAGRLSLSVSGSGHTAWPRVELDLGLPF